MVEQGYPNEFLTSFDFVELKRGKPEPIIQQMDRLLAKERCLAIMEKQGCSKGGQRDKDCKAFAKSHAGKMITEKLALICGCCAGHFMHHYQTMLGVKLHLKETVSSPLDTNGELPCSFTFVITE